MSIRSVLSAAWQKMFRRTPVAERLIPNGIETLNPAEIDAVDKGLPYVPPARSEGPIIDQHGRPNPPAP